MKKLAKFMSFMTALIMTVGIFQMPANALKLAAVDYKIPGGAVSIDTDGGSPDATAYLDSTVKYSGDYSLKVQSRASAYSSKEFRVSMNMKKLEKNSDYKLSFMMKADKAKGFQVTITGQSNWWQLTKVLGNTFDWMPVELEFNYPADAVTQTLVFISYAENNGVWIDDLKLYKKGEDGIYKEAEGTFTNGDFEDTSGTIEIIKPGDAGADESTEVYAELSDSDAVIVEKAKNITIDADPSDWEGYEKHPITDWYTIKEMGQSLEADIRYAYDEEAFYYLLEVTDDEHNYVAGSTYWSGDGIQSVFDNNNANGYGAPIGVYYDSDKDDAFLVTDDGGADLENGGDGNVFAKATRSSEVTTYEVKVPWAYLGMECPEKIKFNLIVNDNDKGVRHGFLRIAEGIGESGKNNSKYPYMFMGENGGSVVSVSLTETQVQIGEAMVLNMEYSNARNIEENIRISYENKSYDVTIKPMSKYKNTYILSAPEDVGTINKIITISDTDGEQTFELVAAALPDDAFVEEFIKTIEGWVAELREMQDECTKQGLATDYETSDIRLLETYIETIPSELSYGEYGRIALLYESLPVIYEECRDSLRAILSGEKETEDVPKYVTSELTIRDGAWWGTVEKDGIQYESPVVFNGINSFLAPEYWYEDAKEYGWNGVELGVYAREIIGYANGEFYVIPEEERYGTRSDEYAWERVIAQLEACDKYGISVSLMVNPMAWTNPANYGVTDYKTSGENYHEYHPFNLTHPLVEEQAEMIYSEIAKLCEKYECIDRITMQNEPNMKTLYQNSYYFDDWTEFLSDRYDGDISKLNKVYGEDSDYKDFSEVKMPSSATYGLPLYHDYSLFAEKIYADYVKILADAAKRHTGLPVCIKEMQRTRKTNSSYTSLMATNIEKSGEYLDLAGMDAFYVQTDSSLSLDVKMMWYDYCTSVMEAPVVNGEDHIGSNGQGGVDTVGWDDFSFGASNWQGIIHGGGSQETWMYVPLERAYKQMGNASEFEPPSNLIHQPNALRDINYNNLDALRLAWQVNALYTAPKNVGIFWSATDWTYNSKFMNAQYRAYVGTVENGQKAKFITESTLDHLDKVDVLIIPATTHTLPEAVDAIKEFTERGGKVIMIGESSLSYDDFNQPFEGEYADATEYIRNNATIIESDIEAKGGTVTLPDNFNDILFDEFEKLGYTDVVVIDKATGERATGIEFIHTEYDGKMIINPFNYSRDEEKTVEIYVNGEKAEKITDLKGGNTYYGDITLGTQQPYLVEIDMNDDGTFKDISHVGWAKESIYGLKDRNVVNGVGNGKFEPDLSVTREEIAKMLVSVIGSNSDSKETVFDDVESTEWYAPYVSSAYENGIVKGISDSTFGTGEAVTRQDLAVMVYRAAVNSGKISPDETYELGFSDSADITDYATDAVAALVSKGAINGSDNNMFKPTDNCTRAEAAKIIFNIFYK